jgi:hypothetical protein
MGWLRCGDNGHPTVDTTADWTVMRAHARAMKQLAQLNRDWMEIASVPEEKADEHEVVGFVGFAANFLTAHLSEADKWPSPST